MAWKVWDEITPITLANNEVIFPEDVYKRFPVSRSTPTLLQMIGGRAVAIEDYAMLKEVYNLVSTDPMEGINELIAKQGAK